MWIEPTEAELNAQIAARSVDMPPKAPPKCAKAGKADLVRILAGGERLTAAEIAARIGCTPAMVLHVAKVALRNAPAKRWLATADGRYWLAKK